MASLAEANGLPRRSTEGLASGDSGFQLDSAASYADLDAAPPSVSVDGLVKHFTMLNGSARPPHLPELSGRDSLPALRRSRL